MKKIRRRTRNRIAAGASLLGVFVLGVIMVTVFTKAGYDEFDAFVGDAQQFGIVAEESMWEEYTHSASNFATKDYQHGTESSTGAVGNIDSTVLVGNIGEAARFSMNNPDRTTVIGPEDLKQIVASGGGAKADLTGVNNPTAVKFTAWTKEAIEAKIEDYMTHARTHAEAVAGKNTEGAILGFYDPQGEEPEEVAFAEDPGSAPDEPTPPDRIDEIVSKIEKKLAAASDAVSGGAAGTKIKIKSYDALDAYIAAVEESYGEGTVDDDFQNLVAQYFDAVAQYEEELENYKEEVADYKELLKKYEAYQDYLKAYAKWEKKNVYTNNLYDMMLKHKVGLAGDGEINRGDDLKKFVIVDVTDVKANTVYVDMSDFFESDVDEALWVGRESCEKIRIYKRTEQTIVFNASTSSVSTYDGTDKTNEKFLPAFYLVVTTNNGKGDDVETFQGGQGYAGQTDAEVAKSIIWNFTSSDTVHVKSDTIRSTIIAPDSKVVLGCQKVCGHGWIICKKLVSHSEWYYVGDGKVPTPTPTPTEEVTPTPTPTPTEEVTPTPTPTPTEEVTPTPAPTPTEEVTPTPTPTEEVTPTPEVTATPAPTSTPTTRFEVPPPPQASVNPPTATPTPVVTETPTATPLLVIDETVPLSQATQAPETELPPQDVPLSNITAPTTPDEETETVIEPEVPLVAAVPETGDSVNPVIPIAGMGISLLAILGVVILRKKKMY